MYIMYVDESGDTGLNNSPSRYFGLSGVVVHESRWRDFLTILIAFKKRMRNVYGLPIRAEIHASEFVHSGVYGLERHVRLAILRNFLDELKKINYISATNIIIDKNGKDLDYQVFNQAWMTLFQRFENTLNYGNFPGNHRTDSGFVITDATNGTMLARLVRKMAVHNYIPNIPGLGPGARNRPIERVIEDPYGKDSSETLPLQAADLMAYFLTQRFTPNSYISKKNAQYYFDRTAPILNTRASRNNPLGIVAL